MRCYGAPPTEERGKWRTAGLTSDSHLPEPPFRTIRTTRGVNIEDHYEFGDLLGRGSFGVVHAATDKRTGKVVAIKSIEKNDDNIIITSESGEKASYHQEFELLRAVNEQQEDRPSAHNTKTWGTDNSHVTRLLGAYDEFPNILDDGEFHFVQEKLNGGELYEYLAQLYAQGHREHPDDPVVSESLAISFAQQMLQAVEACHFTGFAHLDIKPENFIFEKCHEDGTADPTSRLVLVDFGCAESFAIAPYARSGAEYVVGQDDSVDLHRAAGTLMYVSPEVISGYFSSRSDVWSIGAVLFLMLHGATPYASNTLTTLSAKPANVPGGGIQADWSVNVSKELQTLVMKLLSPKAKDRMSASEALDYIAFHLLPKAKESPAPELKGFPPRLNSAPRLNSVDSP